MTDLLTDIAPPEEKSGGRILYRAFGNASAYIKDLFSVYRSLYYLPTIPYHEKLTDRSLFDYCLKRNYYTLVVPYTGTGEILVERTFANDHLSWGVIGGGLKPALNDNFVDAVQRTVSRFVQSFVLGEIEPIAFLDNSFEYEGEVHHHRGIAFIARVRNTTPQSALDEEHNSRTAFVPLNVSAASFGLAHHRLVVQAARAKINEARKYSFQEEEIEVNRRYRARYIFHSAVVKPVLLALSKIFYKYSIDDLNHKIDEIITYNNPVSTLDVACGENLSHIKLAAAGKVQLVVGNDISWSQIELMKGSTSAEQFRDSSALVLFTNHDARRLPFADKSFGCVICKNVLHHMPDQDSVEALISEIRRVGRRSLVVEVLDPVYESAWGRLRHQYYLRFLKDAGTHFISRAEFRALMDFADRREEFEMQTVRGIYQFAIFGDW